MFILAVFLALLVTALAIYAAYRLLRRSAENSSSGNPSILAWTLAIASVLMVVAVAIAGAGLASTGVQTRLVMAGMEKTEPFATIVRNDPSMRPVIREAVRRGLSQPGPRTTNIKREVQAVVRPYMTYRLSHLGDALVVRYARMMLASLERAAAAGSSECSAVLAGDGQALRRYADRQEMKAFIQDALRSEPADQPATADRHAMAGNVIAAAIDAGLTPPEAMAALNDKRHPSACRLATSMFRRALAQPESEAAAVLRGFGVGVGVVTN